MTTGEATGGGGPPLVPQASAEIFNPVPGAQITSLGTSNTYTFGEQIGEGFFSIVYSCTDVWKNELAVKCSSR